jgi:hypothetical protein
MTDPRHYRHHLVRALVNCALAIVLVLAVIAVSGLTVTMLEKPKLQSQCPALIESYKITGVPKHIQIKCKEFL